ncbi:hypothetical protein MARPO_0022s0029 [Marchantia polymorpha]|uniref:Uncharacterized protein n=1 Tax=Marchantia polymorpha TaxID=3197 RepID=A0A2R6XCT7_MARPO|nr:hypothetical protein MARPO_0022s0029 [Marchantia polymorpha]|eukprot:PTQ43922.1 hypothetical protein MARPO_0022s0029 [Marchantia polymorpha]
MQKGGPGPLAAIGQGGAKQQSLPLMCRGAGRSFGPRRTNGLNASMCSTAGHAPSPFHCVCVREPLSGPRSRTSPLPPLPPSLSPSLPSLARLSHGSLSAHPIVVHWPSSSSSSSPLTELPSPRWSMPPLLPPSPTPFPLTPYPLALSPVPPSHLPLPLSP